MAKGIKTGGRQAGTPNKATADVKEAAQFYTEDAIKTLAAIMTDVEHPAAARVSAASALLDRGHGKPKQAMDLDANVKGQLAITKVELTGPE